MNTSKQIDVVSAVENGIRPEQSWIKEHNKKIGLESRLIAFFMDGILIPGSETLYEGFVFKKDADEKEGYIPEYMDYSCSWEWLMPAIVKMCEKAIIDVHHSKSCVEIKVMWDEYRYENKEYNTSLIRGYYKALVWFVKLQDELNLLTKRRREVPGRTFLLEGETNDI
ncbi:MAG: hypothetical protein ABIN48_07185 [Ginsengibacter sp.]